jgi:hypothetical protein
MVTSTLHRFFSGEVSNSRSFLKHSVTYAHREFTVGEHRHFAIMGTGYMLFQSLVYPKMFVRCAQLQCGARGVHGRRRRGRSVHLDATTLIHVVQTPCIHMSMSADAHSVRLTESNVCQVDMIETEHLWGQ